eukprot:COSAG06_NODE_326_length_17450_cov_287.265921_9_plen_210_part_00
MQHGGVSAAEAAAAAAAAAAATAARQVLEANRACVNARRAHGNILEARIEQLALELEGCRLEHSRCRQEQSQLASRDAALEEYAVRCEQEQELAEADAWWENATAAIIVIQSAQRWRSFREHVARLKEERQQRQRAAAPAAAAAPPGSAAAPGAAPPRHTGRVRKRAAKLRDYACEAHDEGQDNRTKRSRRSLTIIEHHCWHCLPGEAS